MSVVAIVVVVGATLTAAAAGGQSAQPVPRAAEPILKTLNEMLASHAYNRPKLAVAGDGLVTRTDSDQGQSRFNLRDIGEMTIEREGESHVLLRCKGGARCITRQATPSAQETTGELIAFSIYPANQGDAVLKLFKDLQQALSPTGGR